MTAPPRHILAVIVASQFAGTSVWFAGNALLPDLQAAFGLPADALAGITSAVQLGFIAGTLVFAITNVADRHRPRDVFLACALLAALANAAPLALAGHARAGDALYLTRFATGFFLAGIYPVGMKIAASWYRDGLGAALGWLVGALVLGTAFPHLLRAVGAGWSWTTVTLAVSLTAACGGLAMFRWVPEGPALARAPAFHPGAVVAAFRSPHFRASASGYFGHMWELYTVWAFVPALLTAHAAVHGRSVDVSLASFVVIAAGAVGCIGGGRLSRRLGSARVAVLQLRASGLCCLLSPLAFLLPAPAFLAFLVVWGVVVVGDSPQFSALNAATAPRDYVGSALTIVNCVGFAITVVSLQLLSAWAAQVPPGWWLLPAAIGPVIGVRAMRTLTAAPAAR